MGIFFLQALENQSEKASDFHFSIFPQVSCLNVFASSQKKHVHEKGWFPQNNWPQNVIIQK